MFGTKKFSVLYKPVMTGANCSDTGGLPAISCDTKDAGEEERKCWYWTRERGYWTPFVSLRYTRSNIGGNNQCEGNYINRWACRIMGVGWLDWEKMQTWWHKYMYRQVARRLEESGDGWMNQVYGRLSTTHGHITDCKLLVCMYGTGLVLVRPAASLYSASPLKHHSTGKQWCSSPDHYSDSEPARRSLTLLCWALSRAAEPQILTSFVWRGRGSNHQPPTCQANAQPLHYPAAVRLGRLTLR